MGGWVDGSKSRFKDCLQQSKIKCNLICTYRFKNLIPITFLTGFYVTEVMRRYWDQFMSLPFPDVLALKLVSFVPGKVMQPRIYILYKNSSYAQECKYF
jgi:hypothetical protein